MIHDFFRGEPRGAGNLTDPSKEKIIAEGEIPFCYFELTHTFLGILPKNCLWKRVRLFSGHCLDEQKLPKTPLISPVLCGLPFSDAKYSCMCRKQNFEVVLGLKSDKRPKFPKSVFVS